jgi:FkbM family methyltransferase
MGLARHLVNLLDRPGTRWALARIARLRTGVHVEYDGRWMRVLRDGLVLADLPHFSYHSDTLAKSERTVAFIEASARDSWFFDYHPTPGDVIVDIGAGTGLETRVFANAVGPTGRVYAIEAHPETFHRLKAAVRRNGWPHVTPIFAAITDTAQTVYIENRAKDISNAINPQAGETFSIPVPGRTLDNICEEHGISRIDFLKMNIEGAERMAVRGMSRSLRFTRRVCIACHDFRAERENEPFFATKNEVTDCLHQNGFETRTRDDHQYRFARDHVHGRNTLLTDADSPVSTRSAGANPPPW